MDFKEIKIKSNEIDGLLEKKLKLMNNIYEITLLQKKDLAENAGEGINKFLDLRQKEMDAVDEIDKAFLSCFAELKALIGAKDLATISGSEYPEIEKLKIKIASINDIANRSLVVEKENDAMMKLQMEAVQKEINMVRKGKQGVSAYGATPKSNDGYYIDKKK